MDTELINKFFSADCNEDTRKSIESKIGDALRDGESNLFINSKSYSFTRNDLQSVIITDGDSDQKTLASIDPEGNTTLKTFSEGKHTRLLNEEDDDSELSDKDNDVEPIPIVEKTTKFNNNELRGFGLGMLALKVGGGLAAAKLTMNAAKGIKNHVDQASKKMAASGDPVKQAKLKAEQDTKIAAAKADSEKKVADAQAKVEQTKAQNEQKVEQIKNQAKSNVDMIYNNYFSRDSDEDDDRDHRKKESMKDTVGRMIAKNPGMTAAITTIAGGMIGRGIGKSKIGYDTPFKNSKGPVGWLSRHHAGAKGATVGASAGAAGGLLLSKMARERYGIEGNDDEISDRYENEMIAKHAKDAYKRNASIFSNKSYSVFDFLKKKGSIISANKGLKEENESLKTELEKSNKKLNRYRYGTAIAGGTAAVGLGLGGYALYKAIKEAKRRNRLREEQKDKSDLSLLNENDMRYYSDECDDCGAIKGEDTVKPFDITPEDAEEGATFCDGECDDDVIKGEDAVKPFDIAPEDTKGGVTFSDEVPEDEQVKPIPVVPSISEIGIESKDIDEMNEGFHGSELVRPFNIHAEDAYNGGKTFSRYYDYGLFDDPAQAQQQATTTPQPFTPQQIASAPAQSTVAQQPAQTPIAMTGMTSPTPIPVGVPAAQPAATPTPMNVLLAPTGVDPNVAAQNNTAVAPVVNGSATAAVPAAVAQQQQANQAQAANVNTPVANTSNQSVAQIPSQTPTQDPNAVQPVVDPNQQTEQQKTNSYVGDEVYSNRQFTDYIDGSCNPYMTCEF
jgi:hypothetical protein